MKDIKFGMQRAGCAMISDFMVGIKAVKEAHNARKEGASGLRITPVKTIPVVCLGYWDWTPECLLPFPKTPKGTRAAVKAVFLSLDEETHHALTYGPDRYLDRVRFWQEHLKPEVSPQQYSAAILTILDWAKRCVQHRLGLRPHPWIDKQEVLYG